MSILEDIFRDMPKIGSGRPPRKQSRKSLRRELEIQKRLKQAAVIKSSWPSSQPSGYIEIKQGGKIESNRRKF